MGWSSGVGSAARRIALSHPNRWGPFVIRGEVTGPAATPGGSNGAAVARRCRSETSPGLRGTAEARF